MPQTSRPSSKSIESLISKSELMDLGEFREQVNDELVELRTNTETNVLTTVNFIFHADPIVHWKNPEPKDYFERASMYHVNSEKSRVDFVKRANGFRGCLLPLVCVETMWGRAERFIGYRFANDEASPNTLVVPESIKPQIVVHHLLLSDHA